MERRAFLKWLGLGAATAAVATVAPELVLDPERALWVPGQKSVFDLGACVSEYTINIKVEPSFTTAQEDFLRRAADDLRLYGGTRGGGKTFLTVDMITKEALKVLKNDLMFADCVNRAYDESLKSGMAIQMLTPKRYDIRRL